MHNYSELIILKHYMTFSYYNKYNTIIVHNLYPKLNKSIFGQTFRNFILTKPL